MSPEAVPSSPPFIDRRDPTRAKSFTGPERRQFAGPFDHLSPDASELAAAIDQYKLHHRRPIISFEEILGVLKSLGYRKAGVAGS